MVVRADGLPVSPARYLHTLAAREARRLADNLPLASARRTLRSLSRVCFLWVDHLALPLRTQQNRASVWLNLSAREAQVRCTARSTKIADGLGSAASRDFNALKRTSASWAERRRRGSPPLKSNG